MRFLFVESIDELASGRSARGRVRIPARSKLPPCLIAEAIGQLAGWVAIERSNFKLRPVAGLVGECLISANIEPGSTVELRVEMETCDDDAVAYSGSARIEGQAFVTLERCGAPMLALEDFDDRDAMKQRFALARTGFAPVEFDPALSEAVRLQNVECDGSARAQIVTPIDRNFYADHFPRKHVFPATLLLDAEIRLATLACGSRRGERLADKTRIRISNVKLRTFIEPGTTVALGADSLADGKSSAEYSLSASVNGKRVATAGLIFEWH